MSDDPDWPQLLTEYQAAIEEFAQVSRALTAALMEGKSAADDIQALLARETSARDAVALTRMRLVNLWRDSQSTVDSPATPTEHDHKYS